MPLPHPSVFAAIFVIAFLSIPVIAYWKQMNFGQRTYAIVATCLLSVSMVLMPFQNPDSGKVHWGVAWDPPRYVDRELRKIITPELVDKVKGQVDVSPDLIKNSTTREMPEWGDSEGRSLAIFIVMVIGWFFVPDWIDRLSFGAGRRNAVN